MNLNTTQARRKNGGLGLGTGKESISPFSISLLISFPDQKSASRAA
jgi:hypothetical protein